MHLINNPTKNWTYVYFIKEGDDGPIKIGSTGDVHSRLKQLQTGNSKELSIIHFTTGGETFEKHLQEKFEKYKIRGEWFSPEIELNDYIDDLMFEDEKYGKILSIVNYASQNGFELKSDEYDLIVSLSRGSWLPETERNTKIRYWKLLDSYAGYLNKFPNKLIFHRLMSIYYIEGFRDEDIKIREELNMPTRRYYL